MYSTGCPIFDIFVDYGSYCKSYDTGVFTVFVHFLKLKYSIIGLIVIDCEWWILPSMAIVAEDIGVLVFMTCLTINNLNIYFFKPDNGKIVLKSYTSQSFKYLALQEYL